MGRPESGSSSIQNRGSDRGRFLLAADRRGASYYGRARMADRLGMSRDAVNTALEQLLDARLVEHRPWRPGSADGVWQLIPLDQAHQPARTEQTLSAAQLLRRLGFDPPDLKPPNKRAS